MIKKNIFIKIFLISVIAVFATSCAKLKTLPKHNTPLIKEDIRTLGKKNYGRNSGDGASSCFR